MFQATTALKKIGKLSKRIRAIQGGTSAGKTISTLQLLIDRSQKTHFKPELTSVVSETLPHLKKGAMKDFLEIMQQHKYFNPSLWSKSTLTYHFEAGNKLEFFSADQPSKVHGPRRTNLYINEANNIQYATFDQLEVRSNGIIYLDWNPTTEFWFYDQVAHRTDVDHLILNYRDNEALDDITKASIEQRKNNKAWWRVYGEGLLGEIDTLIYKGWRQIDEIPHEAKLIARWLDFGYTNDPSSIGNVYEYNGGYIVDELLYQKGVNNKQHAEFLLSLDDPQTLVIADSAEPKSIDEIRAYGVNIIGVSKKAGESKSETFVKWSIGVVQSSRISITKRSVYTIKEQRNYLWAVDRDGKVLNVEDPLCANHSMAGIRYVISTFNRHNQPSEQDQAERLRSRLKATVNQSK